MNCWWCHNPESLNLKQDLSTEENSSCLRPYYRKIPYRTAQKVTVHQLMKELRKDIIFFDESGGGVTLSGGEPLIQLKFLTDLLKICQEENIHVALDTSGYASWEAYQSIIAMVNLILFDLKLMDEANHKKYTGVSNKLVLKNLTKLIQRETPVIVRIPLIPDITDTRENLTQIAGYLTEFLVVPEVHLLPYNPMGEEKYKKLNKPQKLANLKAQTDKKLNELHSLVSSYGLQVKIGG
jgi:pyruvate formate lyase activating enzyme